MTKSQENKMHIDNLRGQTQLLTRLMQINAQLFELGEKPLDVTEPIVTACNTKIQQRNRNEERVETQKTQSQALMTQ